MRNDITMTPGQALFIEECHLDFPESSRHPEFASKRWQAIGEDSRLRRERLAQAAITASGVDKVVEALKDARTQLTLCLGDASVIREDFFIENGGPLGAEAIRYVKSHARKGQEIIDTVLAQARAEKRIT